MDSRGDGKRVACTIYRTTSHRRGFHRVIGGISAEFGEMGHLHWKSSWHRMVCFIRVLLAPTIQSRLYLDPVREDMDGVDKSSVARGMCGEAR